MEPDVVIGPFPFHEGFAHGFSRGWGKLSSTRDLAREWGVAGSGTGRLRDGYHAESVQLADEYRDELPRLMGRAILAC